MIPELGFFLTAMALAVAFVQASLPLLGVLNKDRRLIDLASYSAAFQFLLLCLAMYCLGLSFVNDDFSVAYVSQHSNTALPVGYKISAIWGGHEGSLFLWIFLHSGWAFAVALFSGNMPAKTRATVLAVLAMVSIGFLLFLLLTSNPFARTFPDVPFEGRDLNPLLQDFGLIVHPPMLYMGYVGSSVAFAFAIAGLVEGRIDAAWAKWARVWTTVAWAFLTVGIALGSWWAYYELGWGGFWFWDPVENASFMPWLAGVALIHSLAVTEKRGILKSWTVLLAITAFSLSLLGTFLVRSGVLTSVHAFASDPERGLFILVFLALVVGGSLTLFAARAHKLMAESVFTLFSKEAFMLANNILFVIATIVVLLGTLAPLLVDIFQWGKISVGPPFFNAWFGPLAVAIMVILGIGPLLRWKNHQQTGFGHFLVKVAGVVTAISAAAVPLVTGEFNAFIFLVTMLTLWVVVLASKGLLDQVKHKTSKVFALGKVSRSYWGMYLAHIGMAFSFAGVAYLSVYGIEKDLKLSPGDQVEVSGYHFAFKKLSENRGPNYTAISGHFEVTRDNKQVAELFPEKRTYLVQTMPMTEAAIDPGFFRDLYIAMGEPLPDGSWAIRIYHKPFIRWIWLGGLLMAFGGCLAVADKRFRARAKKRATLADSLPAAGAV